MFAAQLVVLFGISGLLAGGIPVLAAQDCPCIPVDAPAPDSGRDSLQGLLLGITLDRYLIESYGATAVSFRGLHLTPSHWGSEFGFGLLPVEGTSNVGVITDLGTAFQSPHTGSVILLKFGATGIYGGGSGLFGLYAGAGVVGQIAKGLTIRLDLTRRWYVAQGQLPQIWLFSVGVGTIPVRR
jgi:hypothetical protein